MTKPKLKTGDFVRWDPAFEPAHRGGDRFTILRIQRGMALVRLVRGGDDLIDVQQLILVRAKE